MGEIFGQVGDTPRARLLRVLNEGPLHREELAGKLPGMDRSTLSRELQAAIRDGAVTHAGGDRFALTFYRVGRLGMGD
jgi:DNA-binding HxlR family transcriptional regulator